MKSKAGGSLGPCREKGGGGGVHKKEDKVWVLVFPHLLVASASSSTATGPLLSNAALECSKLLLCRNERKDRKGGGSGGV